MTENNAETIAALARKAAGASTLVTQDGREFLIIPDGFKYEDVSDVDGLKLAKPLYVKQNVTLETVDSLVDYVNRYRSDDTVLFANISTNAISGLIDYHPKRAGDVSKAARVAHCASMALPYSEEWKTWSGVSGQIMPQGDFARFMEENGGDVTAPSGGELLDAVRDLQAHRKVNFIKAVRTASFNENFEYSDETEARTKGGIELPTQFKLALPVYFGEPTTEVAAFLRWKLDDGALKLGIQLHRAEHVRQAVFKQIVLAVGDRTHCPVVFGKAT